MRFHAPHLGRRASALALTFAAAGCALVAEPDAGVPFEDVQTSGRPLPGAMADRPTGPHVELLTATLAGEEVELAMQRDGEGVCMAVRRPPESSEGCAGEPVVDGDAFGIVMPLGPDATDPALADRPLLISGLLAPGVAAVVATLESGAEARATLFPLDPAQVDGSGFVLALPAGTGAHEIVALDADGTEIGRLNYVPAP